MSSLGTVKMESGVNFPLGGLLLSVGPLTLSEDQFAQVKFVGSATSFISASAMHLEIDYYVA